MASIADLIQQAYGGYYTVTTGEFAPGVAAAVFPTVSARLVRLKARAGNTGKVCIGDDASVTLADGTTDTTSGLELSAGEDTGWLPIQNLNKLYGIGTGATDSVTYMVLGGGAA